MRAVIIGTDFIKDTDGSFKAIETNTNIGIDVSVNNYIDTISFTNFVLDNSFTEIHLIYQFANVNITDIMEIDADRLNFLNFIKTSICEPNEITFTEHRLDENSVTIPFIEDADNKLIIRLSYDTTALLDDSYARDNFSFLKLMHETDENLVPKTYINDEEFGIDNIGETLRDNGNHPNYCIKKRITPTDNKVYPKLYKVNSIEEFDTLKNSLEIDEYIQEYIYNTEELIENKIFHYRSVDLIYGDLNSLNLFVCEKTNILPIVNSCDFGDNNEIQIWDRPRYLSKVLNGTAEISVKLDADETTKIIMNDDTIKTANNLNVNDSVKSFTSTTLDGITFLKSSNWSASFNDIVENINVTSSVVIEKDSFNYNGTIVNLELTDGIKFSDIPHAQIFKVVETPTNDTIETNVVLSNYYDLIIGDILILINNETNTIETKTIQNIQYSFESLNAYRINVEESDLFLSAEETENQSKYAILTHNYDYDCRTFTTGYNVVNCYDCNSGYLGFYSSGVCCRQDQNPPGNYGQGAGAFSNATYGYNYVTGADPGSYCNGNKPSDVRLKQNIKYSHTLSRGFKIYTFEFIDKFINNKKDNFNEDYSGKWQGILAQDLLDTEYENCLNLREDGYFEVDYTKLNLEFKKI